MNGRHYLYRHIRLDKNEPFYVGVGTKPKRSSSKDTYIYSRAYNKSNRSNYWKKIIAKTDFEVEILLESDDYEFIKQREIEFIALYGRRDLGKGTLCNLTDGGDGTLGSVVSEEVKRHLSETRKGEKNANFGKRGKLCPLYGVPKSEQCKQKLSEINLRGKHPQAKVIVDIVTKQEFSCILYASEFVNINEKTLGTYLSNPAVNKTNLRYKDERKSKKDFSKMFERQHIVICLETGVFFYSVSEACETYNMSYNTLMAQLKGKYKNKTNLMLT